MNHDDRHGPMAAARIHAELSLHDLWLRYLALGGTGDTFDLDGYLQGLVPLETFQEDVLAQALNERLEDVYQAYRVPLSTAARGVPTEDRLRHLVDEILAALPPDSHGRSGT